MKIIKLIMYGVVVSLIAGCATTFKPWKLSEIQKGMDKDQVVSILGEPDSVETKDGAEYLYYTYQEELAPVSAESMTADGAIERRVEEVSRTLEDNKYEVIVVDGKMVNYKELQD